MRHVALLLLALTMPSVAKKPREPLVCPVETRGQLFLSPMGEPFRAPKGTPYPVAVWFAGADANHDGKLEEKEITADAARFFKTLDLDHNGEIDPQEVAAYERDVAPEIAIYGDRARQWDQPGRRFDTRYGGAMGAGRFSFLNVPEPVASADADMNRGVSAAEFSAAAARRFALIDAAGRRALTLANLPKTPVQMADEAPCRPFDADRRSGSRQPR